MLSRCVGGEVGYTVFDEEPGTYVLSLGGDVLELRFCGECCDDWSEEDLRGIGPVPGWVSRQELLLRVEKFDLFGFACSVADAFEGIDREEYARNWMAFPTNELRELKHALGDYS